MVLHDTSRGPASGGIRICPYETEEAALTDGFRLARAMTFKAAAADLPVGGGKIVLMESGSLVREEALKAVGRAIESSIPPQRRAFESRGSRGDRRENDGAPRAFPRGGSAPGNAPGKGDPRPARPCPGVAALVRLTGGGVDPIISGSQPRHLPFRTL